MSRCKRLVAEQEFRDAPHFVPPSDDDSIDKIEGYINIHSEEVDPVHSELECSGLQDSDFFNILDCYVNLPEESLAGENPLTFKNIAEKQKNDSKLRMLKQKLPNQYINISLDRGSRDVTCYVKEQNDPENTGGFTFLTLCYTQICSMVSSSFGTSRCLKAVQNDVTMFWQQPPLTHDPHFNSFVVNRVCAMVVDIRPATGAVVTLARILWDVDSSSPVRATCALMRFARALSRQFETVRVLWCCLFVFVFS